MFDTDLEHPKLPNQHKSFFPGIYSISVLNMKRIFYNEDILINSNSKILAGNLVIPNDAKGIVIFVHGSGSSRFSPRNKSVAKVLQESNIATLLFDLLTQEEEDEERWTAHIRFNIPLLAKRLVDVTDWIRENPNTANLFIAYFGASTGAAAALVAAGQSKYKVKAIVSRGGRPDLAYDELFNVRAPTLLIVGERDDQVIELNKIAFEKLRHVEEKKIIIVPKATHLFEEPGTLEQVSVHAVKWFLKYLNFS